MKVKLKTLGCRLNEAELETWAQQLRRDGHRVVGDDELADLVVFNSCAVTGDAARKSRNLIRRTHRENPAAKLVVTGCYATLDAEASAALLGVDLVVSNQDKSRLIELARERLALDPTPEPAFDEAESTLFARGRQRAFIKVQDGCRYRCTFCIVTVARGEERSRGIGEIVDEVRALHAQGIEEVVLTGVHLGGWGSDLPDALALADLVAGVLADTDVPRLRLGSLEPWELNDAFFAQLEHPRFMPHLHLPLQSGSDTVLRRMARRCRTQEFADLAARLRSVSADLTISTDIIVGFPGETDAEWAETERFVEAMAFSHMHVFSYSPRPGTHASSLPNRVPDAVKRARCEALHGLAAAQKRATLERFVGRQMPILWENPDPHDPRRVFGYTPNYLAVETVLAEQQSLTGRVIEANLVRLHPEQDRLMAVL